MHLPPLWGSWLAKALRTLLHLVLVQHLFARFLPE